MNRLLIAAFVSFTIAGLAHAQDEATDNETVWLQSAAKEGAVLKGPNEIPAFLVRVAGAKASVASLTVDVPCGGRVVAMTPARETTLVRAPADRSARVTFGKWKVLHVAVFDEDEQKVFEGAVARPLARVYLNVRPGWDEARCTKAIETLGVVARAIAGNANDLETARRLPAQQDDRICAALLQEALGNGTPAPAAPVESAPSACAEDEIADLLARLEKLAFDNKRVDCVESHARGSHYYTVDQVIRVVKGFSFGEGRVKAVAALAPRIVDRENFSRIYEALTFGSEKDQVRAIEKKLGPPAGAAVLCPDADLGELLERLKKEAFDDGRAKLLASMASSRCFACDQVAKIVKTFTFGDGQVKSVKILLPRIVDRENFDKIYDSVTFEGDKERIRKLEKASR